MPVCIPVLVRNQLHLPALNGLECILCECVHLQEPLHRKPRLDDGIGPLRISHRRSVVLDFLKVACIGKHLLYFLPRLESVFPDKYLSLLIEASVVIYDVRDRKVVAQAYLIVIYIMGRSHLEAARTEAHLHITVFNNRNFLIYQRNKDLLSPEPMVSLVLGVDADCGIRHDCLRTGCGNYYVFVRRLPVSVRNEIPQVIELADRFAVNHLLVTDSRMAHRVPVDHPYAPVDISFPVKIHEGIDHGLAQVRVHGEFGAVPVA